MGHIAHPAFLLIELRFERTAVEQHHRHPAGPAGKGEELKLLAIALPDQALHPQACGGAEDQILQIRRRADGGERLAAGKGGTGDPEQVLGPAVDQMHVQAGIHDQPAHGGRLQPAEQGSRRQALLLRRAVAPAGEAPAQQQAQQQGREGGH